MMTNCKAIDIQSLLDGRKTVQEASKMGFYGAHSRHGAKAQKNYPRATGALLDEIWQMEVHQLQ